MLWSKERQLYQLYSQAKIILYQNSSLYSHVEESIDKRNDTVEAFVLTNCNKCPLCLHTHIDSSREDKHYCKREHFDCNERNVKTHFYQLLLSEHMLHFTDTQSIKACRLLYIRKYENNGRRIVDIWLKFMVHFLNTWRRHFGIRKRFSRTSWFAGL